MTTADDLTPVWQDAAGILSDAFHADTYVVMRRTEVPDGYGGTTLSEPQAVETGRCLLDPDARMGTEGITGSVVMAITGYTAELPMDSVVTETDTLEINGRAFEVISVKRGGNHDLFTVVSLEERGS